MEEAAVNIVCTSIAKPGQFRPLGLSVRMAGMFEQGAKAGVTVHMQGYRMGRSPAATFRTLKQSNRTARVAAMATRMVPGASAHTASRSCYTHMQRFDDRFSTSVAVTVLCQGAVLDVTTARIECRAAAPHGNLVLY